MIRVDGQRLPTVTDRGIFGFFGQYRYLSNFHICRVVIDGPGRLYHFTSSEAAYMAQKSTDPLVWWHFETLSPIQARDQGQQIALRRDWDSFRLSAMETALYAKFTQNVDVRLLLLDTGDLYLEETNDWGDCFLGSIWRTGRK